jgi:hypothetical protein
MTSRAFLRAQWQMLAAADFSLTEVWTPRGLVTYYTALVIELHSRRVHILGSTPHPDEAFVVQTLRDLTEVDGVLDPNRLLICDRDRKWRAAIRFLEVAGVRVIRTPHLRRTAMRMRSDSYVHSKRKVSTASFRSVNGIFDERSPNTSPIITANETIKALTTS